MNVAFLAPTRRKKVGKREAALEKARDLLTYDPAIGVLTWKVRRSGTALKGTRAGSGGHWNEYRVLTLDGYQWQEHIVAWFLHYGRRPTQQIDHINGDRADNRIANLRECTPAENAQNHKLHSDNASGYAGVHLTAKGKWRAQIKKDGVRHFLGDFDSPEKAHQAYLDGKARLHPFNPIPREARRDAS